MTFIAGRNFSSFKINISNDLVAESTEEFFLDLKIPAAAAAMGVAKVSPDNARVSIKDDDSECCLRHFTPLTTMRTLCISINVYLN